MSTVCSPGEYNTPMYTYLLKEISIFKHIKCRVLIKNMQKTFDV